MPAWDARCRACSSAAGLCVALLLGAALCEPAFSQGAVLAEAGDSQAGSDSSWTAEPASALAQQIKDPFYAFFLEMCARDSLGIWTRSDLRDYMKSLGRHSRLPMRELERVERRAAVGAQAESRDGARVERIWTITLRRDIQQRMPYSILGYHPGSLLISRELILSEWHLGSPYLRIVEDGQARSVRARDLVAFRLDRGWIVLDVDGWLDRLLGKKLDDSWAQGFATCHMDGEMRAVALGCNRQNRPLSGELDLLADEVLPFGLPHARGLTHYTRPWMAPPPGHSSRAWQFEDRP